MTKGRYSGAERRRSPRYKKRFRVTLGYEGKTYEIRTIDISQHGVLIPRRLPPPVGTHIKLTLSLRNETSTFEGFVIRHTMFLVNGVETVGIGIDFSSFEYQEFVKDKILIA
jgi:putative FmdB family regulatory protein